MAYCGYCAYLKSMFLVCILFCLWQSVCGTCQLICLSYIININVCPFMCVFVIILSLYNTALLLVDGAACCWLSSVTGSSFWADPNGWLDLLLGQACQLVTWREGVESHTG